MDKKIFFILFFIIITIAMISVVSASSFSRFDLQTYQGISDGNSYLFRSSVETNMDYTNPSWSSCSVSSGGSSEDMVTVSYEHGGYYYGGVIVPYPGSLRLITSDCSIIDNYDMSGDIVTNVAVINFYNSGSNTYLPYYATVVQKSNDSNYYLVILTIDSETSTFELIEEQLIGSTVGTEAYLSLVGGCLNSREHLCSYDDRVFVLGNGGSLYIMDFQNDWSPIIKSVTMGWSGMHPAQLSLDDMDSDGDNEIVTIGFGSSKGPAYATCKADFYFNSYEYHPSTQTVTVDYQTRIRDKISCIGTLYWPTYYHYSDVFQFPRATICQVGEVNSPLEVCINHVYARSNDYNARTLRQRLYSPTTGFLKSNSIGISSLISFTYDVNNDNRIDYCTTEVSGNLSCYDVANFYEPLVTWDILANDNTGIDPHYVFATDIDGDSSNIELLIDDGRTIQLEFDGSSSLLADWDIYVSDYTSGSLSSQDINNDNQDELFYMDDSTFRIYSLDNIPSELMGMFLPYAVDEDGGLNYELAGYTYNGTDDETFGKVNSTVAYDSCTTSDILKEYYIGGNDVLYVEVSCSGLGYDICLLGICYDYSPPTMVSTIINDSLVYSDEDLLGTCEANSLFDVSYNYDWKVNGISVYSGSTSPQLSGVAVDIGIFSSDNFNNFDEVALDCFASNDYGNSSVLTDNITVQNYIPVVEASIELITTNLNCYATYNDTDGDLEVVRTYKWFENDIESVYTTQSVALANFVGDDMVICEVTSGDGYEVVKDNSTVYVVGDSDAPLIFNPIVPTGDIYTDESKLFSVQCTDENYILSGYPKIRFTNPSALTEEYQMFFNSNDTFQKYITLNLAGTYTDIEIECRDGNGNINSTLLSDIVTSTRPVVIGGGGGGGSAGGSTVDDFRNITSFQVIDQFDSLKVKPGSKKLVEFEIRNTDIVDIPFTIAMLYDENPEAYEWMKFENGFKTNTIIVQSNENIGSNNYFARYYIDVPETAELNTYIGYIEIVGLDQIVIYEVEINVVENTFDLSDIFKNSVLVNLIVTFLFVLILIFLYRRYRVKK